MSLGKTLRELADGLDQIEAVGAEVRKRRRGRPVVVDRLRHEIFGETVEPPGDGWRDVGNGVWIKEAP